jgi:hypothetical protein
VGGEQTYNDLSINYTTQNLPDYDWYRWQPNGTGTFQVTMKLTAGGELELHLFTLDGDTLTQLSALTTNGLGNYTLSASANAKRPILVEVKGRNSSPGVLDQGQYDLDVTL